MKNKTRNVGFIVAGILFIIGLFIFLGPHETPTNHNMMITSEEQFIFEMVPHHQEAVDTSQIVAAKTENEQLRTLAQAIVQAQTSEISMMNQWKQDWFAESDYVPHYIPMMPQLESLSGDKLDKAFLTGMIGHHEMAVMMAQHVLQLQPRSEIESFAKEIIQAQTKEISEMKSMLADY